MVSNVVENGKPIGSQDAGLFWHSDLCYLKEPSRGSLFYAREVPVDAHGKPLGDTMFASATAAYDALPDADKRRLAGPARRSIPTPRATTATARAARASRSPKSRSRRRRTSSIRSCAPIPTPGRNACSSTKAIRPASSAWTRPRATRCSARLFEHTTRPEFVYRHQWRVGDFLMWDNCSTQHRAVMDYALPQRRLMERTTLRGSVALLERMPRAPAVPTGFSGACGAFPACAGASGRPLSGAPSSGC